MKCAVIGKGNVVIALGNGLARVGHAVKYGHRDRNEPVHEAALWGDILLLAVPYSNIREVLHEIGSAADGKLLIDVTNPLTPEMSLAIGFRVLRQRRSRNFFPGPMS